MSTAFYVLILLPSLFFAFITLSTFYGVRRSYMAISWVPVTLFLVVYVFERLLLFQHSPERWPAEMFLAVGWASLVQAALGLVLAVRSYRRRESIAGILIAAFLVIIPFFFRSKG